MKVKKILLIIGNALAFTTLFYIGFSLIPVSIPLAILIFVVSFDQVEDLLGLKPRGSLVYLDLFYEIMCVGIGITTLLFGYTYFSHFYAPFHLAIIITGLMIILSSVKDISYDLKTMTLASTIRRKYWVKM